MRTMANVTIVAFSSLTFLLAGCGSSGGSSDQSGGISEPQLATIDFTPTENNVIAFGIDENGTQQEGDTSTYGIDRYSFQPTRDMTVTLKLDPDAESSVEYVALLDAGGKELGRVVSGNDAASVALKADDYYSVEVVYVDGLHASKDISDVLFVRFENVSGEEKLVAAKACSQCELSGVLLPGANLSGVDLSGADLSGADLDNASLVGANLNGADLSNANLTGADLSGVQFKNVTLSQVMKLGSGSYITQLPESTPEINTSTEPYAAPPGNLKVSDAFKGRPIPTNDWATSLVWDTLDSVVRNVPNPNDPNTTVPLVETNLSMKNDFSYKMHPDPLSLKTDASGMAIGYANDLTIVDHYSPGGQVDIAKSNYFYYFHNVDVTAGLEDVNFSSSVLDDYSTLLTTSLWKNGSDELRATFGHGLPFVYMTKNSAHKAKITFNALDNYIGAFTPYREVTYELRGLTAAYVPDTNTTWTMFFSSRGVNSPQAVKVLISYDFNGDGKVDMTQMSGQMNLAYPHDPSYFQSFSAPTGVELVDPNSVPQYSNGSFRDMNNGTIKVQIWKPILFQDINGTRVRINTAPVDLDDNDSSITFPYAGLDKQYFNYDASLHKRYLWHIKATGTANTDTLYGEGAANVYYNKGNVLGVKQNGHYYGIFGPVGSVWQSDTNAHYIGSLTSDLNGKSFYSVALLPDETNQTMLAYEQHAYAFPVDSNVSYSYDEQNQQVTTTFNYKTDLKENGYSDQMLEALYRHQWLNLVDNNQLLNGYIYNSARGTMKVITGNSFQTDMTFPGVLPTMPNPDAPLYDKSTLLDYMNQEQSWDQNADVKWNGLNPHWNTYGVGIRYGKMTELTYMAELLGDTDYAKTYISMLEQSLDDWLTYSGPGDEAFFYYDQRFKTLIGMPAGFGSNYHLNDHHFHYGYFVKAAAMIAQYDPEWAIKYGPMIKMLIADVASKKEGMFTQYRNFDPYAGHSWASGNANGDDMNNQESSSEAMNFATGVILYGAVTGDKQLRDLGIYLYTTELSAIEQYWFDIDNAVFPTDYPHMMIGLLWADGGMYGTFFNSDPQTVQAINYLPLTGGSFYLGDYPNYVLNSYNEMQAYRQNWFSVNYPSGADGKSYDQWFPASANPGVTLEYLAFADPVLALQKWNNPDFQNRPLEIFQDNQGESKAHQYYWLNNMEAFGHVDKNVRGDIPTSLVFNNNGTKTYVAFNPTSSAITVHFTDGGQLDVPAKQMVTGH